jgi:WD40 repeat protein
VWDAATGNLDFSTDPKSVGSVHALAWSPVARTLATLPPSWNMVTLWDAADWNRAPRRLAAEVGPGPRSHTRNFLAWSPDGNRLAAGAGVWDLTRKPPEFQPGTFANPSWAPDGSHFLHGAGELSRWDVKEAKTTTVLPSHADHADAGVGWSHDGRILAISTGGRLRFWDTARAECFAISGLEKGISEARFAWSPREQLVAVTQETAVTIREPGGARPLRTIVDGKEFIVWCSWSPDGKRLLTQTGEGLLQLWDAQTGKEQHKLQGHMNALRSVRWSDGGRVLETLGSPGLRRWDVETGAPLPDVKTLDRLQPPLAVFSPAGDLLMTAGGGSEPGNRRVERHALLDGKTGQRIRAFDGYDARVICMAWSPDGKRFVVGSEDGTLTWWDPANWQRLHTARAYATAVIALAWSADSKRLATACAEHAVHVWDADGRACATILTLAPSRFVVLSGDGHFRLKDAHDEDDLVYVVQTDRGQDLYSPAEFARKFGWENDPKRVRLSER